MTVGRPSRASSASRLRIVHALPVVPVFLVAFLASGAIRDNSFLWHIRAGAVQADLGRVLDHDIFSFTELGASWRTQSWLAELGYAQAEQWFSGLGWANWFVFGCSIALLLFSGLAVYRRSPSPVSTALVLVGAVWLYGPFLQPRPVILSFVLLAALVVVFQNRDDLLWLVVPIMWVWAGVHGSWIIGGLIIVLHWLRTMDRRLFMVGVLSLVASLATPHGLGTWGVVVDFLGAQDALALMQEWKVPDFGSPAQMPYVVVVVGLVVAGMRGALRPRDLWVIVPFLFLGVTSRRTVVPATIVLLPYAAAAIPPIRVPKASGSSLIPKVAVALVAVMALFPMVSAANGTLLPERFPDTATRAAMGGRNTFYDTAVGGYLIYREYPERLVWIDDRAELYGVERLEQFADAVAGTYTDVFAEYDFDSALVQPDWPLMERLVEDGWTIANETEYFTLFYAPGT